MAETPPFGEEPTGEPHVHAHPSGPSPEREAIGVTPGKVAIWFFLATEVMFFTGLIGTYIVLRAGSPSGMMSHYSNLFPPGTDLSARRDARGLVLDDAGNNRSQVVALIADASGSSADEVDHQLESTPTVVLVDSSYGPADLDGLRSALDAAGATTHLEPLEPVTWPMPYRMLVNPLSIDLTALNTFILICSSVTMVLALAAIQRGDKAQLSLYLLATIAIGSTFLGIQMYEYYQLMVGHRYSIGVSADGHFRPSSSLFASCFFTMTGFHGAHVTGGCSSLAGDLAPIALRRLFEREPCPRRARRALLALRRPRLDHPFHRRLSHLRGRPDRGGQCRWTPEGRRRPSSSPTPSTPPASAPTSASSWRCSC